MNRAPKKQDRFVRTVLRWYGHHGRTLPWRNIRIPYRILVSEVMLQQTQVRRVLEKYPAFLRRFPSLRALARARRRDVVLAWQGMGYNNRAVRLHQLARIVLKHHGGRLPRSHDELIALPGIGRYTADAMRISAFSVPVPAVDVNVRRFLSRVFYRQKITSGMRSEREISRVAAAMSPQAKAYDFNQALMDIGAMICTARQPRCRECPVRTICASAGHMRPGKPARNSTEPMFEGRPARFYRGRVVELLREKDHSPIPASTIAATISGGRSRRHHEWTNRILQGLERDGLIRILGNGSHRTRRVTLA